MYHDERDAMSAAQRSAARRRYEDDAPRLRKEIPSLSKLRIEVTHSGALMPSKHTSHIVVGNAPALFVFYCSDPWCGDGGHDVTSSVLYALRALRSEFSGNHSCEGTIGSASCRRTIEYKAFAEYER